MKFFRAVKEKVWLILLVLIPLLFFYQTILFQKVPFPGDLIVGEYAPYNSYSFLGYVPGSFPNKGQNFDVAELLYPAKYFSVETFRNLEVPLWNPYNFSGTPHLASLQSGSFYPLGLIFYILPFLHAWSFYIYIQPILAGIFTFLFLRELRLGQKSSFLGALSFAFSSYLVVWIEYGNIGHSILWLPLLMFFSLKFLRKPSLSLSLAITAGLTLSLLAGYIQTSFYFFVFLLVFMLFNIISLDREKRLPTLLKVLPVFILPVLLSSMQLLPMLELLNNSTRTAYSIDNFFKLLIPKIHIATLFAPDFFGNPATRNYFLEGTYIERVSYVGVMPLIFGLFAVIKRQSSVVWFFILSLIAAFFMSFDTIIARSIYSLDIPLLSTAVPTRVMFIFCFSLSVLAAFGFEYLQESRRKDKRLLLSLILVGSVFAFLWGFVLLAQNFFQGESWLASLSISKRNLILPSGIFALGAVLILAYVFTDRLRKYILIGLIILTVFDLYYFFQKITPFSPKQSVYPKTEVLTQLKKIQGIDRSWGYGSAYLESNIQTYEKIFSADGYDALHSKRYSELVSSSQNGNVSSSVARSEAEIARGFGKEDLRNNRNRQNILNLLGVKYLLHKVDVVNTPPDYETFDETVYEMIWDKGNWQIYENKSALARVSLFGNHIVVNDKDEIIKTIHDPAFNLKETLILEDDLPSGFSPGEDKNAKVSVKSYKPNSIVINTSSAADSLLFISDSYYQGWKAKVDNVEQKIYRADYAFRAVVVPKGSHEVAFSYYPDSFNLGLKVTGVTLFILLLLSISKAIKIKKAA